MYFICSPIRCSKRDQLQKFLASQGIITQIHYPYPPHEQKAYRSLGYEGKDYPVARMLTESTLSLPLFVGMEDEQIEYVANKVSQFFKND